MVVKCLYIYNTALVGVIAADEMQADPAKKTFLTGNAKAHAKATKMVKFVKDPFFWHVLAQ